MIKTLGRQVYPDKPNFLPDAFNNMQQATMKPYEYLFLDFKPGGNQTYRVRESPMSELTSICPKAINTETTRTLELSTELRKAAKRLIRLAKASKSVILSTLRTASQRLIRLLSEIALNAREGVLTVCEKLKNSQFLKTLPKKQSSIRTR